MKTQRISLKRIYENSKYYDDDEENETDSEYEPNNNDNKSFQSDQQNGLKTTFDAVHLDLINKVEVFKLLKELVQNHNKTIIISTHQIEYALQICDEIWLINNNKIEALSPTQMIENNKLTELFDEDIISFDKASQSFRLK